MTIIPGCGTSGFVTAGLILEYNFNSHIPIRLHIAVCTVTIIRYRNFVAVFVFDNDLIHFFSLIGNRGDRNSVASFRILITDFHIAIFGIIDGHIITGSRICSNLFSEYIVMTAFGCKGDTAICSCTVQFDSIPVCRNRENCSFTIDT